MAARNRQQPPEDSFEEDYPEDDEDEEELEEVDAEEMQRRSDQLEQVTLAVPRLKAQAQLNASNSKQLGLLKSVASGLYEELDKLCKKAPAEPLTDLALVQANDLISEVKQLIAGDQFVQKLAEFIPAGDNPQHRDAVIVLRMIRQGLDRYEKQLQALSVQTSRLLNEAKAISGVLHLFSERDYWLDEGELKKRELLFRRHGKRIVSRTDSTSTSWTVPT